MSGITVGSRLEQLERLRTRLDQEIAQERLRVVLGQKVGYQAPPARPERGNRVQRRLRELGVTSLEVKRWAADAGLIDGVHRGRVAAHLVELFAEARERLNECIRVEA